MSWLEESGEAREGGNRTLLAPASFPVIQQAYAATNDEASSLSNAALLATIYHGHNSNQWSHLRSRWLVLSTTKAQRTKWVRRSTVGGTPNSLKQ